MKKFVFIGIFFVMTIVLSGCSRADGYYRSGKKYFSNGNYEEAAKNFSLAIGQNPNRADYYIDYGMALIGLEHYDKAMEQFDRVIMEKKIMMVLENNKRALRGKGIIYFKMQDYEEAVNHFDLALNLGVLSDLDMDILYYKGKALVTIGDYERAAETYTRIIEQFGENAQVLGDRAYTYFKMEEYDKGLEDYDRAIALQSNLYELYFGKYYLLQEMGREEEAQALLKIAAQIQVKTKADKYNLAKIHFYQGLYDQALPELSESFANGFVEAYFYIGEIYSQKKDYSTAKYYYEKYIEEGIIDTPAVYNQIASCLIKMGEYEQAISYLEKGIEFVNAGMMRVLLKNEIIAYEHLGDYKNALTKLQNYITTNPNDQDAIREVAFITSRVNNQ